MEPMNPPEQTFRAVRVLGILYIAAGAFSMVTNAASILLNGGLSLLAGIGTLPVMVLLLPFVLAILQIVTGIFAVRFSSRPEKAQLLILLVAGLLVLTLTLNILGSQYTGLNLIQLLVGCIFPAFFLLILFRFKKMADAQDRGGKKGH